MNQQDSIYAALINYEVEPETAQVIAKRVASREVFLLAVSGKMGSGKDTTAPILVEESGYGINPFHSFFAKPLKTEVNQIIDIIKENAPIADAAQSMNTQEANIGKMFNILALDIITGEVNSSYDRTSTTRWALQYWGTDVRRVEDEQYWVKKAVRSVCDLLVDPTVTAVFVTDARFINEMESLNDIGAFTVRLNITKEEQDRRIFARDGIHPTQEALNHVSETALDNYKNFHIILEASDMEVDEVIRNIQVSLNDYLALAV